MWSEDLETFGLWDFWSKDFGPLIFDQKKSLLPSATNPKVPNPCSQKETKPPRKLYI